MSVNKLLKDALYPAVQGITVQPILCVINSYDGQKVFSYQMLRTTWVLEWELCRTGSYKQTFSSIIQKKGWGKRKGGGGEGEAGKFERINKSYWLLISSQFRVVCAVFLTFHEIFSRKI